MPDWEEILNRDGAPAFWWNEVIPMRKKHSLLDRIIAAGRLLSVVALALGPVGGGPASAAHPLEAADGNNRGGGGEGLPNGATARLGTTRLRHGAGLVFAAYLPDGRLLLTVSKDKTVRLWDLATGREVRRYLRAGIPPGQDGRELGPIRNGASGGGAMNASSNVTDPIAVASLSRDGDRVAVALGRAVCLWETATGKRLHEIEAAKPFVLLAFSPDGGALAGVDVGKGVTVWNAASGRVETRRPACVSGPEIEASPNMSFNVTAISPDLKHLDWNHLDLKAMRGWLRLTAVATGKEPRGNPFLNELPPALAFSPDGRSLLWAGNDQNVHVTEIATGKETLRTENAGLNGPICGLTPSSDCKTLGRRQDGGGQARDACGTLGDEDGEAPPRDRHARRPRIRSHPKNGRVRRGRAEPCRRPGLLARWYHPCVRRRR